MTRLGVCAFAFLLATAVAGAQDVGVTPPRALRQVEPDYSPAGRENHVQGRVLLQIVINEKGRAVNITVLSPLGFGLDEEAVAAVEKWEFAPGTKDGQPVSVLATVEVNFKFLDDKPGPRRVALDAAVADMNRAGTSKSEADRAVKTVEKLARKRYRPAMFMFGMWEIQGDHVKSDPADGLELIENAAAERYGPALYEVGSRRIEGRGMPKDVAIGLADMHDAANLGSPEAQAELGDRYDRGDGVPRDADQARKYFRLCSAQGVARCQYRLGSLMYDMPSGPERSYEQAIAWFQLAGEQGVEEAKDIASREAPRLTPEQTRWITGFKAQLASAWRSREL